MRKGDLLHLDNKYKSITAGISEAYKYGHKLDVERSRRHFYTCVEGMEEKVTNQLNKDITVYEKILPTDYKSPEYGSIVPVEDSNIWLYYN